MNNTNLKAIRTDKKIKQQEIAAALNISQGCYASWEQGRTEPNLEMLIKLADIFGCSIDYLVGREGDDGLIRSQNEIEKRKELRPSTLKLVDACASLNDMGIAVVIGYIARLIEENPEFLLPSARRI